MPVLLIFQLGPERYGVALEDVAEVLRAVAVTRIPGAPAVVEGVIDLRGEVVPVFGMRRRFGCPEKPLDPSERMIVARSGGRTVALRVDGVEGIGELEAGVVEEAARVAPGAQQVTGVARLADGLVLIHDLRTFLTRAESERLDRALEPVRGAA